MDEDQARSAIAHALAAVAPELDLRQVPADVDLRGQLDLDSIDFLCFVEELERRAGVRIDAADESRLHRLDDAVAYLVEHVPSGAPA